MDAKKMKDRCWFATDEGKCANPEENTQGAACSRCEAFVKLSGPAPAERCGDCGHRDPAGDYCFHNSCPRKSDEPACRGFKPKGVGVNGKTAAAEGRRPLTTHLDTRLIDIDEIEPHPDALNFWGDEDEPEANSETRQDAGALESSVAESCNITPAIVVQKEGGKGWWLLDGCGRLAGARKGAQPVLLCEIVHAEPADYAKIIMSVNMYRRRVSSGGRVLRYLEMYRNEVLAAADDVENGLAGGRGRKNSRSAGTAIFSSEAIRERLHCRKQDVSAGILLLKCKRDGAVPYKDANGKWQLRPGTDDELSARDAVEAYVRKGKTPINRWVAGFQGKFKTDKGDEGGRAATDYARSFERQTVGLRNVFAHWHEVEAEKRPALIANFCSVMIELPADFHRAFEEVVESLYPKLFEVKKGSAK